jgi:putative component of membrane protein insertase Oxa1/YidC/SpoIIIJ protein YidD
MLRALLLGAVHFYRRHLARCGPFAGIRCTFQDQESCSAYGKRMLEEESVHVAVPRIVRRLRRCRHLSLYRLADGGVGWGADYDALVQAGDVPAALRRLDNALTGDSEGGQVRLAVGNAAALARAASRTKQVPPPASTREDWPLVRDLTFVQAALLRRWQTRGVFALLLAAAGTALAALGWTDGALVTAVVAALPLASAAAAWGLRRRLEDMEVLAGFDGPTFPKNAARGELSAHRIRLRSALQRRGEF